MKKNARLPIAATALAGLATLVGIGCTSSDGGSGETAGQNTVGSGGTTSIGGSVGSGGTAPGTGGGSSGGSGGSGTGGSLSGTGGTLGSGGSSGSGGTVGGGGMATGGGGAGTAGGGGTSGSGGSSGAGLGGAASGGAPMGGATSTGGAGAGMAGSGGSAGGAVVSCPATSTVKAGDNNESMMSGGENRTFIVHVPSSYDGKTALPVILDFHPLGGTGSQQEGSSGWKAKCDSVGCIAVYPDSSKSKASDNSWNAGYRCTNAEKNQVDDVQFARDIVKWLEDNACVDSKRIYASGGSNGGAMTYRMACEAADIIAAAAPVDFRCVTGKDPLGNAGSVTAANNTACTCTLPRPLSIVAWDEGADGSIVPYNGGQTPQLATDCPSGGSCVGIGFTSAVINADTWAKFNGCTGSATADPNNSLCKTYSSCMNGTTVTLCTTTSGGHLAVYGNSGAKFTDTSWNVLKTQALP